MKKAILVLMFTLTLIPASWSIDFSLGGGGLLGLDITRYTLKAGGILHSSQVDLNLTQEITQFNYGGFLFFDTTFAEFNLIIQGGSNTYNELLQVTAPGALPDKKTGTGTEAILGFSLLRKYPFTLHEGLSIFPLLGIEYRMALMEWRNPDGRKAYNRTDGQWESDKNGKSLPLPLWNSFWIDLGVGFDYALNSNLYLRGELLYGFRLQTSYEADGLEQAKNMVNDSSPSLRGLTSGPTLKIAIGYRFKFR